MVLDATRTINGSFGEVLEDGEWLTNVTNFEATVDINKEEVHRSGTRWTGHKVTSLTGTGSMTGFKVTTNLIEKISQIKDDRNGTFVTELIGKVNDPEQFSAYRVRLKNVQFDEIDLLNYEVNSLVEEELPFTFSDFEFLDKIEAD